MGSAALRSKAKARGTKTIRYVLVLTITMLTRNWMSLLACFFQAPCQKKGKTARERTREPLKIKTSQGEDPRTSEKKNSQGEDPRTSGKKNSQGEDPRTSKRNGRGQPKNLKQPGRRPKNSGKGIYRPRETRSSVRPMSLLF